MVMRIYKRYEGYFKLTLGILVYGLKRGLLVAPLANLWVWLVLGEVPSQSTLQGGILILVTLIGLAAWAMREEKRVAVT